MTTFHLTVVTPDGCAFEGQAERVVCRAIDGDLAILAKHGDYCTAVSYTHLPKGRGLKLTDTFQALPLGELDAKRPERARTLKKSIPLKEKEL